MLVQVMSPCNDEMVPNGPCEENGCGLYYCRLLGIKLISTPMLSEFVNNSTLFCQILKSFMI